MLRMHQYSSEFDFLLFAIHPKFAIGYQVVVVVPDKGVHIRIVMPEAKLVRGEIDGLDGKDIPRLMEQVRSIIEERRSS